jgi:ADP-heptose:LPS heptosyltransferase
VVLPNVWTEVDNLLNRFPGERKWAYIERIKELTTQTTEKFLTTKRGVYSEYFISVGLTDSLLVELGKECDLLITADTFLSDIAAAHGIKVYDLVRARTENLRQ